jgi:hypothetical protein
VPHPILKKTRGPSTTGPRPTARFISPHESEDDPCDPELSSARVVVQPPSPDRPSAKPEKRAATSGSGSKKARGFVSSPSTKRPVVFRRKSSQSSTESPARSVETASSGLESSLETPAYLEADDNDSRQPLQAKFRENFSPSNRLPSPSRNRQGARNIDSKRLSPRQSTVPRKDRAGQAAAGSAISLEDSSPPALSTVDRRSTSEGDLIAKEQGAIEARKTLAPQIRANESQLTTETPPRRSQSDTFHGSQRTLQLTSDSKVPRDAGVMHYLSSEAKSTPSLAPTLAAAAGQLALGNAVDPGAKASGSRKPDKGKRRASDEARTGKTSPRKTALPSNGKEDASSLARSKSQLALVLEKDRARSGDRDVKKE